MKTKLLNLAFWFIYNLLKLKKKKKNRNSFYPNVIDEKEIFGEKNQKLSLIHQNDGLDELIMIMDGLWSLEKFLGTFGRFLVHVWGA